jgi:hypothetical protein
MINYLKLQVNIINYLKLQVNTINLFNNPTLNYMIFAGPS